MKIGGDVDEVVKWVRILLIADGNILLGFTTRGKRKGEKIGHEFI